MTEAKNKLIKPRLIMVFLILVFMLVMVSGFAYGYLNTYVAAPSDQIVEGVKIDNVDVGGMQREEALAKVKAKANKALKQTVNLKYQDRNWEVSLAKLGVGTDLDAALNEAAEVGHAGNIWDRYLETRTAKQKGKQLNLNYVVDKDRTSAIIAELTQELNTSPADAGISINERGEIVTTFDKPGTRINSEAAAQELESLLSKGVKEPLNQTWELSLSLVDKSPNITREDLQSQKINELLATYTTRFQVSNVNRTYNVKVAAEAINHQVIKPGETFSFNKVVGPRSQEAGYREALIIQQNEFVPGLGGGVCQVSSTLYNAVLLADLQVVERSNHSLPVDYVPAGRDATVAYGVLDLRFVNNTQGHLLLQTKVKGNSLTIQIYGDKSHKKEVELSSRVIARLEPQVVKKPNPELEEGKEVVEQAGKAGLRVQVYRTIKEQGKSLPAQLISTDTYKAVNKIIQVGTNPLAETPAETPPGDVPTTPTPGKPTKPPAKPDTDPTEPPDETGTDQKPSVPTDKPGSDDPTDSTEPPAKPVTDPIDSSDKPGDDSKPADPPVKPGSATKPTPADTDPETDDGN